MRDRIDQFSAKNKSPQCGALWNKYSVCGVNFPEPRAEVYCVRLNFISDRNWTIEWLEGTRTSRQEFTVVTCMARM